VSCKIFLFFFFPSIFFFFFFPPTEILCVSPRLLHPHFHQSWPQQERFRPPVLSQAMKTSAPPHETLFRPSQQTVVMALAALRVERRAIKCVNSHVGRRSSKPRRGWGEALHEFSSGRGRLAVRGLYPREWFFGPSEAGAKVWPRISSSPCGFQAQGHRFLPFSTQSRPGHRSAAEAILNPAAFASFPDHRTVNLYKIAQSKRGPGFFWLTAGKWARSGTGRLLESPAFHRKEHFRNQRLLSGAGKAEGWGQSHRRHNNLRAIPPTTTGGWRIFSQRPRRNRPPGGPPFSSGQEAIRKPSHLRKIEQHFFLSILPPRPWAEIRRRCAIIPPVFAVVALDNEVTDPATVLRLV